MRCKERGDGRTATGGGGGSPSMDVLLKGVLRRGQSTKAGHRQGLIGSFCPFSVGAVEEGEEGGHDWDQT